jgi:hypothetical protein
MEKILEPGFGIRDKRPGSATHRLQCYQYLRPLVLIGSRLVGESGFESSPDAGFTDQKTTKLQLKNLQF